MTLAVPGTNEPFSTAVVNANFEAIDTEVGATRTSLTAITGAATTLGGRVTTIEVGAGRGNLAREVTATPVSLTAIADGLVGDRVLVTTPATGVDAFFSELWSTPASTSSKWRNSDSLVVDTKAHLDTFIAAWIADTDLTFRVGTYVYISGTRVTLQFVTTAGVYRYLDSVVPVVASSVAGTGVVLSTNGRITVTAGTTRSVNGVFTGEFDNYLIVHNKSTASVGNLDTLRLRAAGSDASSANYDVQNITASAASIASQQPLAATSWTINGGNTTINDDKIDVYAPFLTQATRAHIYSGATNNPMDSAQSALQLRYCEFRLTTSFDGFTLIANSGNVTEVITIFGWNNLT